MSYIKIEFGGKERGLKFNQLAIEIMSSFYDSSTNSSSIYGMFYGGLRGNSFVKREEPDYTFEDVCEWVDKLYAEKKADLIKQVTDVLMETELYKSLIDSPATEEKKSKQTKKRD